MSASHLAVARGLRELHRLTSEGRLDSPEADAVRDATDAPWEALTEVEKRRLGGLSEDLYSITDPARSAVRELNPQAQARLVDIFEARRAGEWDRAIELIRRWGAYLDPAQVSYLRGMTWLEAGDLATAIIFFEHATLLQPEDGNYLVICLSTLQEIEPQEAVRRSEEILLRPDAYPLVVVATATNIMFAQARGWPAAEATSFFRHRIPILEAMLGGTEEWDVAGTDFSVFSMGCYLLGFCHEFLGENQAALSSYSRGLAAKPADDILLVARGTLLYGESPRAIDDFRHALRQGSTLVWPVFYLAHHHLITGQFEQCRVLCERGLGMEGSDAASGELAEWLAIAQAELGFPDDIVRRSFDLAIRHDPSSERARRNLAIYETATRPIPFDRFVTRTTVAVRASGLSERRINPAA